MAVKKNVEAIFPLSPMQEGMLFHSLYAPVSGVYVTQSSCLLRGDLAPALLEQAWGWAMARHAALRTSFVWERLEKPVQVVHREVAPPFRVLDWSSLSPEGQEDAFAALLEEDRRQGYLLTQVPLMRFVLIRLGDGLHRFLWSHHHLISDGWSNPLVLRDVLGWYEARRAGLTPRQEPARSFRDYIGWLKDQDLAAAEAFWRRTLAGFTAPTPLGIDWRAGRGGHEFDERKVELPPGEVAALRLLASRAQVTLNTLFQGAWALLLSRYAGQEDVLFGATVSGRPPQMPGSESIVGLFINTLPVRVSVPADGPLIPWLQELQARVGEMRQFEHTPLVQVHGWSEVPRDTPLFESLLVFENYPVDPTLQGPEASLRIEDVRSTVYSNYPLAVLAVPGGDALTLRAKFDRERFEAQAMEALLAELRHLLRQFAASPDETLAARSLVAPEHRAALPDPTLSLEEPAQEPITRLVGVWAERTPEAPAVAQGERTWSYAELAAAAHALATELAARGLHRGEAVAVQGNRSFGLISSLLGVFASGGVLLPLDGALPGPRRRAMLEAAKVRFLVQAGPLEMEEDREVVQVDPTTGFPAGAPAEALALADPDGDEPAYVFFTSGTTGTPKGVLGRHKGLAHFLSWQRDTFGAGPGDRAAQLTGLSFDVVLRDVFLPLVSGATLCLPTADVDLEAGRVLPWLRDSGVTLMHTVPSIAQAWLADPPAGLSLPGLRRVFFAGEPLTAALVRRWREVFRGDAEIVNLYGPTETTLAKCCFRVSAEPLPGVQPVGRPMPQTQALVLSPERRLCGVGEPGEIAIRTPFRTLGYLDLPEENGRRFLPNPFTGLEDDRIYLTGDRGRYRPDGTLEVLGRVDDQIKIRGVRVEPAEVAAVLARHPGVKSCFVLGHKDERGEASLVAYVVSGESEPGLRAWLGRSLPPAMVPSFFVFVDRMPLTPNGKVDRRALPAPGPAAVPEAASVDPRTPAEELLAGIWAEVLRRDRVGALDNFFELGGHSLKATQVSSRVRDVFGIELPLRALFEEPVLAGLAARIESLRLAGHGLAGAAITPAERGEEAPLSFSQQRLWFLHQLAPGSPVYNIPGAFRLSGRLDVDALARTLAEVVRRHEVLRTTFEARGGEPVQVVHPEGKTPLNQVDLTGLSEDRRSGELHRLALEGAARPFDLAHGPMLRVLLARMGEDEHVVLFTLHHIVSDGWSRGVLVREIAALYPALAAGGASSLPELPVQYADFAAWQRRWLQGEVLETQLGYWRRQLAGPVPPLELPADRPRPAVRSFRGSRLPLEFEGDLLARLRDLGRKEGVTLFMTLLAAFQALLHRYTGQEDFAVGSPMANRNRRETEGLIGFFVNTLVLRADLAGEPDFRTLLKRARETALGAYAHQDLPFEQIVEDLQPERNLGQTPLFQVLFVLHNAPRQELALPGLTLSPFAVEARTTKFDLTLTVLETPEGISAALEHSTDLFDEGTVRRLGGHLGNLLAGVAAKAELKVADLPLLSGVEERQLIYGWNDTGYPAGIAEPRCVHEAFEDQAARNPEAVAVVDAEERLTFAELNRRANQLAHHLQALGVGPESRVGVLLERTSGLAVSLLAVLKAGGAYVPIDPRYPAERVAYMLEDAGLQALVTRSGMMAEVPACPLVRLDADAGEIARRNGENPVSSAGPGNAVYVIYTSGSTGRPKGVVIEHRQLLSYTLGVTERIGFQPGLSYALLQPPSFDSANTMIFPSLLGGGALHILPEDDAVDPERVAAWFEREGVDCLKISPSHLAALLAADRPERLLPRYRLVLGGEASRREWAEQVARLSGTCVIFNHYGPTETTVGVMTRRLEPGLYRTATVPIGLPLPGSRTWVLDRHLRPCPLGVPGELYIGGAGVGRGYLGRPELTAERFVPNPFPLPGGKGGERLYRTGDLVRRLPDGNVEFLGRLDHQVKIRGVRIELSEIEAALARHPGVRECAVMAWEDGTGDRRLAAYVVSREGATVEDAADFLRESLPEAMVPSSFTVLDDLPRNRHGKLDRGALPRPDEAPKAVSGTPPRTPAEEIIAGIWAEVLGRDAVGVHDDFFVLGGHSLLATRIVSRLRTAFGADVPVRALFEAPTVAGLASRISGYGRGSAAPPVRPIPRDGELPLSFSQERLWFLARLEPGSSAYNVAGAVRLLGALDAGLFERSLREVVRRHEALRTTFSERDGLPVQVIHEDAAPAFSLLGVEGEERLAELALEEGNRPFDLQSGPLVRVTLLRLSGEEHVVLFTLHHIVSDAWSREILVRELATLYQAFREERPSPLPELAVQYADFAAWQRRWLTGDTLDEHLRYWRGHLDGAPPVLELPSDRARPSVRSGRGGRCELRFSGSLGEALRRESRRRGATPFMTLLAAFYGLLHRYTGQATLSVGSPIANRNRVETEGLIGFFANTLVLRADLEAGLPFAHLLDRVREAVLDSHAHQDMPFERLVEALQPRRDLSHTPLFQVMFVMQNAGRGRVELPGLTLQPVDLERGSAKFDLTLVVEEGEGGFSAAFQYDADLFDGATARRQLGHWAGLLEGALADPEQALGDLPFLGEEERRQLVAGWNDTAVERPGGSGLLHERFRAQARRTPEAVAVRHRGEAVSYRELDRRSDLLAHRLRELGVGPEVPVGICVRRTPAMVAGLLGILKAGGAYVPLDPAYPRERLAFMLEDSAAPVLVTEEETLARAELPELCEELPVPPAVICLDGLDAGGEGPTGEPVPPIPAVPDNLAYLIYTSGSTGRPKGVAIAHRSAVEMVRWARDTFSDAEIAGMLAATSICFDLSVFELFLPLCWGGTVVLAENALDLQGLPDAGRVTQINTVPSAMTELVRLGAVPPSVLTVSLAGEPLKEHLVDEIFRGTQARRVWNLYGPSEDTTYSTQACMERGWSGTPPIGVPLSNTRAFVLDAGLRLLPVGVPGELYLGGEGLARGYLGRPEQTAERFIPDPYGPPGSRLYRTGDLVRRRATGELDFLGRIDHQVKIRGYRIELGEIESVLLRCPGLRETVVVARPDASGEPRLVAYVASDADAAGLRSWLHQSLPEYMVPGTFIFLDALPLTPNGKVDRKALPAPDAPAREVGRGYVPPRTPTEERVAAIWSGVLGLDPVGAEDDFFEIGGHSLAAVRVVSRLREAFGVDFPLRRLFEAPTVAGLARVLDGGADPEEPLDLRAEAVLDPCIRPAPEAVTVRDPGAPVLLTGATGFLGSHLLAELLRRSEGDVCCLVRARSEEEALERLRASLKTHGLWDPSRAARIVPVPGDLSRPWLGLSEERFGELAETLGAIYHNGAWVNLSYPYPVLKATNVLGTQEVLRLAATGSRVQPVHHVSTLSVFFAPEHAEVSEDDPLEHAGGPASGYAQSKWVAEQLVQQARSRGVPVSVYRFGRVSWNTETGSWNPTDFLFQVLQACAGLGLAPDVDLKLDLVPVDYVSQALVTLSQREEATGRSFHLVNPHPTRWKDLVAWLGSLSLVPYPDWMRKLEETGQGASPLLALADVRSSENQSDRSDRSDRSVRSQNKPTRLRFDDRNTREGLAGTGVACPALSQELVLRLLANPAAAGLLGLPAAAEAL